MQHVRLEPLLGESQELSLISEPAVPTQRCGNVLLDLVLSNIPGAQATQEQHLATGSDHATILITTPGVRRDAKPQNLSPEPSKECRMLLQDMLPTGHPKGDITASGPECKVAQRVTWQCHVSRASDRSPTRSPQPAI